MVFGAILGHHFNFLVYFRRHLALEFRLANIISRRKYYFKIFIFIITATIIDATTSSSYSGVFQSKEMETVSLEEEGSNSISSGISKKKLHSSSMPLADRFLHKARKKRDKREETWQRMNSLVDDDGYKEEELQNIPTMEERKGKMSRREIHEQEMRECWVQNRHEMQLLGFDSFEIFCSYNFSQMQCQHALEVFPSEIWSHIGSYLGSDLASLVLTSTFFRDQFGDDSVFQFCPFEAFNSREKYTLFIRTRIPGIFDEELGNKLVSLLQTKRPYLCWDVLANFRNQKNTAFLASARTLAEEKVSDPAQLFLIVGNIHRFFGKRYDPTYYFPGKVLYFKHSRWKDHWRGMYASWKEREAFLVKLSRQQDQREERQRKREEQRKQRFQSLSEGNPLAQHAQRALTPEGESPDQLEPLIQKVVREIDSHRSSPSDEGLFWEWLKAELLLKKVKLDIQETSSAEEKLQFLGVLSSLKDFLRIKGETDREREERMLPEVRGLIKAITEGAEHFVGKIDEALDLGTIALPVLPIAKTYAEACQTARERTQDEIERRAVVDKKGFKERRLNKPTAKERQAIVKEHLEQVENYQGKENPVVNENGFTDPRFQRLPTIGERYAKVKEGFRAFEKDWRKGPPLVDENGFTDPRLQRLPTIEERKKKAKNKRRLSLAIKEERKAKEEENRNREIQRKECFQFLEENDELAKKAKAILDRELLPSEKKDLKEWERERRFNCKLYDTLDKAQDCLNEVVWKIDSQRSSPSDETLFWEWLRVELLLKIAELEFKKKPSFKKKIECLGSLLRLSDFLHVKGETDKERKARLLPEIQAWITTFFIEVNGEKLDKRELQDIDSQARRLYREFYPAILFLPPSSFLTPSPPLTESEMERKARNFLKGKKNTTLIVG